jgi:hypothetical protein
VPWVPPAEPSTLATSDGWPCGNKVLLSKASIPRKTGNLHLQHPPPFARLIDKASNFFATQTIVNQLAILNPQSSFQKKFAGLQILCTFAIEISCSRPIRHRQMKR